MNSYESPKAELIIFNDESVLTTSACACGMYTSNDGMNAGMPGYPGCVATSADAEEHNFDVSEDEA